MLKVADREFEIFNLAALPRDTIPEDCPSP